MEIEERIISEIPLDKGWSNDKKSIVTTPDGRFVRRIIDDSRIDSTSTLFFHIGSLNLDDNPFSRPMELDFAPSPARFYTTYVEGEDLEEVLCTLSQKEQIRLGYEAGFALKKIHTRVRVKDDGMWAMKYNAKIDRKIKAYQECGIKVMDDGHLIDRINSLRIYLEGRPQTFQHGDYHVGNFVLTPDQHLGILDFDRWDIGDPWEEFNRIVWCADLCPVFASARIDAYFNFQVPESFFPLLFLYQAVNALASLPWAIPYGEKEVAVMLKNVRRFKEDTDDFANVVPKWYVRTR
ncbi:MAG: hypothetical protein A2Y20_06255 [Firmicutes bacterium GWF2_51_9]|nr:phosphotransferase [Erysipelotrichaceae bacterium]OGS54565.1 MAG: hypothetical protein A2Y20_06255 [Firmicutes bacterium GWF2_51_9]OGS59533.1 MAG: hypothetical protein A2Y19_11155 [Firmicutes bacterium GWE2_51_13]HAM63088.1 phosphotransferase family protein [Erysipelotrichaceae bacterium]HAO61098.1 phosphotransferase family protein [Erysipelotrichaceae bacterium]